MITKLDKNGDRKKRHIRLRKKIKGTASLPRFNVYRSLKGIYVQIIDDDARATLVACSTMEKEMQALFKGKTKSEAAKIIGGQAAKKALKAGISNVVFDRGGYIYTGRVQKVADGAREAGLKF